MDIETTGMCRGGNGGDICGGHRIIEIGCVEIIDQLRIGGFFQVYINPHRTIDPKATAIHGISDYFLRDKPSFEHIVKDLIAFIGNSELIIHNAKFDIAFLEKEFSLLPKSKQPKGKDFKVLDTLILARRIFPFQRNDLNTLQSRFNIDIERKTHGALLDANILARVYMALIAH